MRLCMSVLQVPALGAMSENMVGAVYVKVHKVNEAEGGCNSGLI